ncbi:MAG: type I secretion system permease/ATPase [Beijerinckiaceae bacterium]|nr:type I secretion system permease/ATPase [Beijerinckiaceae bacterium]
MPKPHQAPGAGSHEIRKALSFLWSLLGGIAIVSGFINLLYLTGPLFMLQVYDRVLASHSVPTLIALSVGGLFLYCIQGVLDYIRGLVVSRAGTDFHESLSSRLFQVIAALPMTAARGAVDGMQAMRDLDAVRAFISGSGPAAFLDLPWMPVYLLLIYLLNPLLAYVTVIGAVFLALLTIGADAVTVRLNSEAAQANSRRSLLAEAGHRNAEIVKAMGIGKRLGAAFSDANAAYLSNQQAMTDKSNGLSTLTRIFRLIMQSGILAMGAYSVLRGDMSAGVIIAASITSTRALAPLEGVIAHWKGFVAARKGIERLEFFFSRVPVHAKTMALPAPKHHLSVSGLYVGPPGIDAAILKNISLDVEAGQALGVIGASAAGKSTLARAIAGVWTPLAGDIRLDGARLEQWDDEECGRFTGYLPQDVELFEGTIAQNIARFDPDATPQMIIDAATTANVHMMIIGMDKGYETVIGENGAILSAGQRQRIGLARALYGNPFLVVLDEPNSNLDADGEAALSAAILSIKQRGCIVVLIAHRSSAIANVDLIAVIETGKLRAFGPKDDILRSLRNEQQNAPQNPVSVKLATIKS